MAYIGVSPSNGVRQKHTYTATASQTTFSGAGSEGISLSYRDSNYVDVYRNGVKLGDADYTATSGTSIVLGEGAAVNDIVEIVVYDVFSVADTVSKADGGTFDGNVAMAGTLAVTGAFTSQGIDDNADATAITIDGGGSVLIGKSTPTDLHNTWNHLIIGEKGAIISENGSGGIDGISISDNAYIDSDTGAYAYQTTDEASIISQTGGNIIFSNAASGSAGAALSFSERMRISSGNLLVGKTADDVTVVGTQINNDGFIGVTRSGNIPALFNRTTSDGDIVSFRRDGSTVGSIGAEGGQIYIVNGDTGLKFASGVDGIIPVNAGGANRDNAIDLGVGSVRFKNLYLSGGVYLGGTGSANELDDYEEGTWTANATATGVTLTVGSGVYTKVGNIVYVSCIIGFPTTSSTDNATIDGFPFTCANGNQFRGGFAFGFSNKGDNDFTLLMSGNTQAAVFHTAGGAVMQTSSFSAKTLIFQGVYQVA